MVVTLSIDVKTPQLLISCIKPVVNTICAYTVHITDVSHDSDDSGLGHALLESPLLPPPLSPLTATPLTRQLNKLEPFPLSPEGDKMYILLAFVI